jgi:hypothetical protein
MRKPCKSCAGNKKSLNKTVSKVLKLGATTQKTVEKTEMKPVVLTGENNTLSPRLSPSPIFKKLEKDYKRIGKLQFPSRQSI